MISGIIVYCCTCHLRVRPASVILLFSSSLESSTKKGAQGELSHANRSGHPDGVTCKNVELGVLFHSSRERAYYVEPPRDCRCRCAPRGALGSARGAEAATAAREEAGVHRRRSAPRPVPLPVPFVLDSEAYSDRENGSPHARFPPFMHTLSDWPRWVKRFSLSCGGEVLPPC